MLGSKKHLTGGVTGDVVRERSYNLAVRPDDYLLLFFYKPLFVRQQSVLEGLQATHESPVQRVLKTRLGHFPVVAAMAAVPLSCTLARARLPASSVCTGGIRLGTSG